jgi:3D (Asp-Asp-Asp) domain-containing protein
MLRLKNTVLSALASMLVIGSLSVSAFAAEASSLTVKLEALTGKVTSIVNFTETTPVTIDNRTLVPVRTVGEAAGLSVGWNQATQTATLTLAADAGSDKPIEQYAYNLVDAIGGYGLDLKPHSITADLVIDNTHAKVRYNFVDTEGDMVSLGKNVDLDAAATLVNDGSLMIPLRAAMGMFGLETEWNSELESATVSIPNGIVAPSGLSIVAPDSAEQPEDRPEDTTPPENNVVDVPSEDAPADTDPALGTYIGRFKITHYCTCAKCNGGYGNNTAWAGKIVPGQTIAVDPSVIGKLSWVYVDGYGLRRAEDCGGAIKGYHIDMAVSDHDEAMRLGVVYKDVYYAN